MELAVYRTIAQISLVAFNDFTKMRTNQSVRLLLRYMSAIALFCLNESFAMAFTHYNSSNFSQPYTAFDDFSRMPSCRIGGIIRKLLSWGYDRSDGIAHELIPLANDMRKYSALHRKILKSWETGSPVWIVILKFY